MKTKQAGDKVRVYDTGVWFDGVIIAQSGHDYKVKVLNHIMGESVITVHESDVKQPKRAVKVCRW